MLPIVAYGSPFLRKKSVEISPDYPGLNELIQKMFETMYASKGVGLAAPQVGYSIRLFIVDASPYAQDYPEAENFKKIFINPKIISETGEEWTFSEGCLSIPGINEDVTRKKIVEIEYWDENFNYHKDIYDGIVARIIQHEYDHLEGILFVDRISFFRKQLIKGKLNRIAKGIVEADYKMVFNKK